MATFEVRPFRRTDRDHLTRLVNRHIAAVMPGATVSVNTALNQLEREPSEFIVDPWVADRKTLVAEQAGSIAAAALLHRFSGNDDVSCDYQNHGEIRWFVFWPMTPDGNPFWRDGHAAATSLMRACIEQLDAWKTTTQGADGRLPYPGVYGVPAQWPHVEDLYEHHGFVHGGHTEIVLIADIHRCDDPGQPPIAGLTLHRLVGINGTRFAAQIDDKAVGYIEVEQLDQPERHRRGAGLADIGNLVVDEAHRSQGIGRWLVNHAARWLRLGGIDRLITYISLEDVELLGFLEHCGFTEITRTRRGWTRPTL